MASISKDSEYAIIGVHWAVELMVGPNFLLTPAPFCYSDTYFDPHRIANVGMLGYLKLGRSH